MIKQIIVWACVAWCVSAVLGLLFAAATSGRISIDALRPPGVVPVAMLISTGIAVLMTPLVVWAFKSGQKSLIAYGAALFALLVIYMIVVAPTYPGFGLYGSVLLAIAGLVIIGFIPR
jgi:hypothetical protein